jgi:putative hemolysin
MMLIGFAAIGPAARAAAGPDAAAGASAFCRAHGGAVQFRSPYANTNDDQANWLRLSGGAAFCQFTAKDGSRIALLLSTLYTTQPTLAALAYYAQTPLDEKTCPGGASPGSCYCTQLGGSDLFGGVSLNGGGWVLKSDPVDTVLDACVFPDMSSIDSYGLFYHSAKIVRGKNLKGILRFPDPYK